MRNLEDWALLVLVTAVSLLFAWTVWPFAGAILWSIVLATLVWPVHLRLHKRMPDRPNLSAAISATGTALIVILPLALITSILVQQISDLYAAYQAGQLTILQLLQHAREAMPEWTTRVGDSLNAPTLSSLVERLSTLTTEGWHILARQAISFGQHTISTAISVFVMLYLLYFLLRDGAALVGRINAAIPLRAEYKSELIRQFVATIRALLTGSIVVAVVQGGQGALIFWLLAIRAPLVWGACIAVLSLLPVLGTGLVWIPVSLYLIATSSIWQGILLLAYGVFVIEMTDNLLRPIIVGVGAQIPDYVVLVTTLGGIAAFGINGFILGPIVAALFQASWHVFGVWRGQRDSG